jgi:DNA-binding CsgD family transcriptional regulator
LQPSKRSRPHTTSASTARDIRALAGGALSPEARILAAAGAYQAKSEPRPHRGARPPDDAARQLREDVRRGRLDADAVDAVLGAAGHRVPRRREGPAGLTRREVEVLVLLARGLSNKAIAAQLVVSPKTVGHHIEHIYRKIDCSTRAAASLFAMQHGLLPELEQPLEDGGNARCAGDPPSVRSLA